MKWISFNEIEANKRYKRARRNYIRNKDIGIKFCDDKSAVTTDIIKPRTNEALLHGTVCDVNGIKLLYCQYGGNFPLMKFSFANMAMVICEVMAAYNALKLCGYIENDDTFDEFFRLSCEFEVNAPYIIPTGHFGSDYKKIGSFLESRRVDYTVCRDIDSIDALIKDSDCCIISYRYSLVKVHTFCCFYDNGELVSINRGSGCLYLWHNNSVKECLRNGKLLVGYAIKRRRDISSS